ncbi:MULTISPECIES: serine/threonine-protein kinase [Streptomyces]|uniref:non-specific serine/threonine protein kinase n=1 Tax=Streptomyces koelreuteriae TaxID=2838015 RepID=A0ABX8FX32_9ACTN|nr:MULTISPECIES: PQQ-binding-like beta-propeller repeat protein [Streptomyces]QWB25599.1 PQQ-binding-like beta-propeller repeat protein [Streptomyces koelreuteriae]UUA08648.1 serine/threonine-protein kinase [Streptomyces koelreuteriae]UUA16253.1 serine/threonine-protein kinase [Streptomyces sp. CRCS-T-1]
MALRDSDPSEVGGYRIEDRLGSGGMGVVYLARSASGRRLAVKVVHGQYADDDEFRARFRREVAAARQVSGAFTAPVVDAGADASRPWMATLYIPGADLGTHVREHGPLSVPRLRELAAGLAEALRDIHRAGVVHRDLKPANVMLAEDGPRVIDFGISRAAEFAAADVLTQTGRVMGTPPFMSPEQFSSPQDVGPAADIFSLGSVLTYAATRRGPFDSPSPYETAVRVVEGEPVLDGVPDELLPFVRLCLEKHPKSRVTADELLTLLRDGGPIAPRPATEESIPLPSRPAPATSPQRDTPIADPPPEPTAPRGGRRRRYLLAAAAGTAVAAVLAATTVVLSGALSRDSDPGPSAAARSDLPDGWKPWAAAAKIPKGSERVLGGVGSPLTGCSAVDTSLVCAGSGHMATRFALADGRTTWARPVDPTPDGSSGSEGALIGTTDHHVYAYESEEGETAAGPSFSYTVYALAADTGKELWRTRTGAGESATVPDSTQNAATAVPEGVVTFYGPAGDQYALLDAETGDVRWKRPKPDSPADCLLRSAAGHAYLVCAIGLLENGASRTTVSQIDPATGKTRWTVDAKGTQYLLGQHDGRLVLADTFATDRGLTLIDVSSRVLTVRRLAQARPEDAQAYLVRGTVYFTRDSGGIRAVSPRTGRTLWESNSTVEKPGPPTASATHVYVASPSGRLAALDASSGEVDATRDGRDDGGRADSMLAPSGAPLVLVGDALYVPYGIRSVYTVDVRDL